LPERITISLKKILEARKRIQGFAFRSPAYKSYSKPNAWLKLECYQPVRSFKIRGASNKMLLIPKHRRKYGVITASSGNHGLAVAYVAQKLGIQATIVLPETVIPDKLEWIKSLGARTILFGRQQDERARTADEISKAKGQIFVQPFNDEEIIAGQSTCGLEIIEDVPDAQEIFVPIGGGGLISGIAAAVKLSPRTKRVRVIGVQPEGSPSMFNSWKKKELSSIESSNTIADGLSVRKPGEITFSYTQQFVDDIVLVNDDEILQATYQLLRKEHVLSEPSGAAAFAGLLKSRGNNPKLGDRKSVAVVSGGNISQEVLSKLLSK
jgi:threonine dehydratase